MDALFKRAGIETIVDCLELLTKLRADVKDPVLVAELDAIASRLATMAASL